MKQIKLNKLLTSLIVALSLVSLTPITANAEWRQSSNGQWWYDKGSSYSINWEKINGTWYFFDSNGFMKTGWLNDNGTWYYLNNDGSMAHDTIVGGYTLGADGAWITQPSTSAGSNGSTLKSHKVTGGTAGSPTAAGQRMAENNR